MAIIFRLLFPFVAMLPAGTLATFLAIQQHIIEPPVSLQSLLSLILLFSLVAIMGVEATSGLLALLSRRSETTDHPFSAAFHSSSNSITLAGR